MDPALSKAFLILMVGMVTVFTILLLVAITGKLLIRFVNRYFPGEPISNKSQSKPSPIFRKEPQLVSGGKMAAIVAAVEVMTKGKGQIIRIERVNEN